jgi:hypothetical protein
MFEIKGYKRENLVEFSKRRMQILAQCPANSTWQTREDSWDRTRKRKERIASTELKARWHQEASDLGIEIVKAGVPTLRERIQVELLLDNVNESEAELDRQEGVKVPTHGGGVRVPISREDELDTTPVR